MSNADSAEIQLGAGQPWKPLGASPAASWVDASCSPITIGVRAKRTSDGAVDPSPPSQQLTVTPAEGCAAPAPQPAPSSPSPADTLAKSGFDANTTIVANDTWNDWQWLKGLDQTTGFDWTGSHLWGSAWPWGVLTVVCSATGSCPSSGVPSDYATATIATIAGHDGQLTKALKLDQIKPNPNACCQQVAFGNSELDLSSSSSRDYYMRARWRFDPRMASQAASLGNSYWRQTWVYKTLNRNRIQVMIYNRHGYPTWYVQSDDVGATASGVGTIYWASDSTVAVPLDQWFTIEIAYHRAPDSTARFFLAVNGKTISDVRKPTMGTAAWEEVNNIAHASTYATQKLPNWMLVDDLEVRRAPPCAALPCGAS